MVVCRACFIPGAEDHAPLAATQSMQGGVEMNACFPAGELSHSVLRSVCRRQYPSDLLRSLFGQL